MACVKQGQHGLAVPILYPPPRRANGVEKAHADAGALPFRHDDQAASPRLNEALTGRERDVSYRLVIDKPDVTRRGDHLRRFQIMMRLKIRPPSPVGFDDPQFDWRTSLKPPPEKAAGAALNDARDFGRTKAGRRLVFGHELWHS